jgi:tetratricopeptide (TPR) repeat protein
MDAESQTALDLARKARSRGDRTASLEHFRAALAATPGQIAFKLEIASDLRELGRLDEAEAVLQEILRQTPQHFGALVGLGHTARKRNDRTASLAHFEAAAAADPNHVPVRLEVASDLRELGRLDEAAAVLHSIIERQPNHFAALMALSHLARQRGDHPAAIDHLLAASHAAAPNADARLALAAAFRDLAQFDRSDEICRDVVINSLNPSKALTELGLTARARARRTEAFAHFTAAVEANSRDVRAKLELATELRDRHRYDDASRLIDEAIQLEPSNVHARMQRGYLQRRAGNHEAARDEFRQISETFPGFLQALVELALAERALGNPLKAEQILEQVIETKPNYLPALEQLGELARLSGNLDASIDIFHYAIDLHPGSLWPYLHASQSLDDVGEHAEALDLLQTATSIFGERPEITCKKAELLKRTGHLSDARHVVETGLKQHPHNFSVWSHCVQFDLLLGNFEAAAEKLDTFSSEIVLELARANVFRGQLAEAQYRFEEARDHYQAALALNPNDASAHAEMFRVCMLLLRVDEAGQHLEAWTQLTTPADIARIRAPHVSQSHMGQVYDEFTLNRRLIDNLVDLRKLPPKDRIAPLQALLRRNADHSAVAIQLVIAMREAKLLDLAPTGDAPEAPVVIPKVITQYWDDPEPPEDVQLLMDSWRLKHNDFRHQRFDDASAKAFLAQTYAPDVLRAYQRAGIPAEKADLFRLAYLFANGGIYVDADDRCLSPISTVLPAHVTLAVYQEDYALGGLAVGTLGNNFLAAAPQNAVIGRALELATEALNRGDTDMVWLKTGPALITRAFAEVASRTPLRLSTWLKNVAVLERNQLSRLSAIHCFTAYKKTTRHWSNTVNRTRTVPVLASTRPALGARIAARPSPSGAI